MGLVKNELEEAVSSTHLKEGQAHLCLWREGTARQAWGTLRVMSQSDETICCLLNELHQVDILHTDWQQRLREGLPRWLTWKSAHHITTTT